MFRFVVTPELLVAIFGAILALAFDWFPRLAPWYDTLSELKKRQLMGAAMTIVVAVILGGSCAGVFSVDLACTKESAASLIQMVLTIVTVNYSVHGLTKPSAAYKERWAQG